MLTRLNLLHAQFSAGFDSACQAGQSREFLLSFMVDVGCYVGEAFFFQCGPAVEDWPQRHRERVRRQVALTATRAVASIVRQLYTAAGLPDVQSDEAEIAAVDACWSRFDNLRATVTDGGAA